MATSPYFSTSNQYIQYDIHVDELSTDINTNTSTVRVYVLAWRTNTGYTTDGDGSCYVNIDGSNYSNSWTYGDGHAISYDSDTVLFDRTVTVPHGADGKKTIYVSAYISHARFSSNSQGFNVVLTNIPRAATLTGAPNFNDSANPTINYSNPAGTAASSLQACISLNGSSADIPYRDINKNGTSYTFNLTQAERNTLLSSIPNSNSRNVIFIVRTVIGGNTYYSSLTRTLTVSNANPVISGASYRDVNSATVAITGNNQKIIQNNSSVTFRFSSLSALKYATLANIAVTVNGVTKSSTISGSSLSNYNFSFGVINSSENLTANIVVTDTRGNRSSANVNITMLAWSLPTGTISLSRKSNYYNETYLTVTANIASLESQNTATIQYQYKEKSAGSYGALTTIQSGVRVTLDLDNQKSYDFRIIVSDRIGSTTYNKVLQIGIPIMYIDRMKRSVGFGTIPDEYNMIAVDRRLQLKNPLQEVLLDVWTTVETYAERSAFIRMYNTSGDVMIDLNGYNGGSLTLREFYGKRTMDLWQNSYGGALWLGDKTGTYRGGVYTSTNGVYFESYNSNGNRAILLWVGGNKDGVLNLYSADGTNTINESGQSGNITCVSLTQTSSRKAKKNISPLKVDEARKILELEAVVFDYRKKGLGNDLRGFIAEDVEKVIPQLVTPETETKDGDPIPAALNYIGMIPYIVETIKDQDRTIKEQEKRISDLESRLADLEKKISGSTK